MVAEGKPDDEDGDDDDDDESEVTNLPKSKSKSRGSGLGDIMEEGRKRGNPSSLQLTKNVGVVVHNCSAQWDPFSREMAFNEVSLRVHRGEILAGE